MRAPPFEFAPRFAGRIRLEAANVCGQCVHRSRAANAVCRREHVRSPYRVRNQQRAGPSAECSAASLPENNANMSEGRRATLMPLGGGGSSDAAVDAKKRRTAEPLSLRLTFVLPESTESTCPVYNFKEELAVAKVSKQSSSTGSQPSSQEKSYLDCYFSREVTE